MLEPFENGMRLLEGEKYVTASWVPFIVEMIRKGIQKGTESDDETVQRLSNILLKDFNNRWYVCVLIMMLNALFLNNLISVYSIIYFNLLFFSSK